MGFKQLLRSPETITPVTDTLLAPGAETAGKAVAAAARARAPIQYPEDHYPTGHPMKEYLHTRVGGQDVGLFTKDIVYDRAAEHIASRAPELAAKSGVVPRLLSAVAPAAKATAATFSGAHGAVLGDMLIPYEAHAVENSQATGATGVDAPGLGKTFHPNDRAYVQRLQGMRAYGGPVEEGKPYLVGEQGPEVVVPSSDAVVLPNPRTVLAAAAPAPAAPAPQPSLIQSLIKTLTQPVPAGTPVNQGTRRRRMQG